MKKKVFLKDIPLGSTFSVKGSQYLYIKFTNQDYPYPHCNCLYYPTDVPLPIVWQYGELTRFLPDQKVTLIQSSWKP